MFLVAFVVASGSEVTSIVPRLFVIVIISPEELVDRIIRFEVAFHAIDCVVVLHVIRCDVLEDPVGGPRLSVVAEDIIVEGSDVVERRKAKLHDL